MPERFHGSEGDPIRSRWARDLVASWLCRGVVPPREEPRFLPPRHGVRQIGVLTCGSTGLQPLRWTLVGGAESLAI
jgi:hypothetical protein